MIKEWTIKDLDQRLESGKQSAMYLYTPMCGTCKLAGKMLEVTAAAVTDTDIGKADLNYVEPLAERYKIESVPCLLLFKDGQMVEKIYKFESVPTIFEAFGQLSQEPAQK
ncbi:thioredoxin family protein [Jeotgalibacillus terrae]|uniref:Thioredoxin family protein n=1 Tax=Jeotgalibacillus terrae TaxID=587735 RepID=A0ABW5ZIW4_9BACL|nr:thioredoxin family protein [Jeotgalibacillus terrae]MBM7580918.1 thioredoxin-like negative regulator of GroEL [Jeotgalibacillus terrae]